MEKISDFDKKENWVCRPPTQGEDKHKRCFYQFFGGSKWYVGYFVERLPESAGLNHRFCVRGQKLGDQLWFPKECQIAEEYIQPERRR